MIKSLKVFGSKYYSSVQITATRKCLKMITLVNYCYINKIELISFLFPPRQRFFSTVLVAISLVFPWIVSPKLQYYILKCQEQFRE